jgi:hypothetical protein
MRMQLLIEQDTLVKSGPQLMDLTKLRELNESKPIFFKSTSVTMMIESTSQFVEIFQKQLGAGCRNRQELNYQSTLPVNYFTRGYPTTFFLVVWCDKCI